MRRALLCVALIMVGCGPIPPATLISTQAVTWGNIQTSPEQAAEHWDWSGLDTILVEQAEPVIVPIYPYALWDQATCHADWPSVITIDNPNFQAPYPPCDQTAYTHWITALVQRYPQVTAWQILGTPTDETPPTAQWMSGAHSYGELAALTADTIHQAQPQAQVYIGQLNHLEPASIIFYTELLSQPKVQTALDGLTVDAQAVTDQAVVTSVLDRAHWKKPTHWVYTKS